jgi:hypothetical protein
LTFYFHSRHSTEEYYDVTSVAFIAWHDLNIDRPPKVPLAAEVPAASSSFVAKHVTHAGSFEFLHPSKVPIS